MNLPKIRARVVLAALASVSSAGVSASQSPSWMEPFPPFRIAENLYYVGSAGLASYLIATPQGHILINSNLEASIPQIQASVTQLGFEFRDVKILLISHAHWDHNAGSARVKELTGATYMVMEGDADVVESGGNTDFQYGSDPRMRYPTTRVDRILHDGDQVKLGNVVLATKQRVLPAVADAGDQ
ncbi:MAG TPA: MBL fold metallo-hydrolase [Gemmatimonadaceae bacterium]|nr:MBL fold metallo-hydrolase [Gemmatimonadaceae bacterium]